MGKNKKWCLLANCYERTLIRNQTVFDFADSIGLAYTPSYRVVDVYHNNKLLGTYLLTDAVEASETRVDIDNEANEFILERDARTDEGTVYFTTNRYGIRLGINEPEEPTTAQYNWLMDFLKNAENALSSGNYDNVKKYFDIDSMIDFYIVLELFKNVDISSFMSVRNSEDLLISSALARKAEKISYIPDVLYFYRTNDTNISSGIDKNALDEYLLSRTAVWHELERLGLGNDANLKVFNTGFLRRAADLTLQVNQSNLSKQEKLCHISNIAEHKEFERIVNESDLSVFGKAKQLRLKLLRSKNYAALMLLDKIRTKVK
jgi:hypothetical protein